MARPGKRPRKFLTADELRTARKAIEKELERVQSAWGLSGWSFVGASPRMRVQVHVDVMRKEPTTAATTIRLPGGDLLDVAIAATHAHLPPRRVRHGRNGDLRPGSAVRAVSGASSGRCGVAMFAEDESGAVYAVTAGHVFATTKGTLEVDGKTVAELTYNALAKKVDAALCRLTAKGLSLAKDSRGSTSWLAGLHAPDAADNTKEATFYPPHGGTGPFVERVESFASREKVDGVTLDNLITTKECTVKGDSGSLLAFDAMYYGVCRGTTGLLSCFTPVVPALACFSEWLKKGLVVWAPPAG